MLRSQYPCIWKVGYTHCAHFRFYNSKFGYQHEVDKWQKMIVIYAASETISPAFVEGAIIQRHEGFLNAHHLKLTLEYGTNLYTYSSQFPLRTVWISQHSWWGRNHPYRQVRATPCLFGLQVFQIPAKIEWGHAVLAMGTKKYDSWSYVYEPCMDHPIIYSPGFSRKLLPRRMLWETSNWDSHKNSNYRKQLHIFCVHVHAYPFYGCCLFACSKVLIPDSIGCTLPAPCHKIDKILKCIYLNTTDYITWPDGSVIAIYLVYLTFSPPRQLNKDLNFETGKKPKNKSRKGKTCKEKANPGSGGKKPSKSATSFKATKASKGKPANKSKARKGKSISIPAVSPEPESQPAGKKPKRHRKAVAWAPMGRLRHVSSHACTIFVSS